MYVCMWLYTVSMYVCMCTRLLSRIGFAGPDDYIEFLRFAEEEAKNKVLYVCMYVCTCVYMYVCSNVCMYYVCMYVCMCVCTYVYSNVCMYVCMYVS